MITIQYQTIEEYCHCCGQELQESNVSEVREFDFQDEDFLKHREIECLMENEELDEIEYYITNVICETISFYAISNDETVKLLDGEIEKVMKFILENYK